MSLRLTLAQEPVVAAVLCHQRDRDGVLHEVECPFVERLGLALLEGRCTYWDGYRAGCERLFAEEEE